MPTARFDILDNSLDTWGCLIKSWATGFDYINKDYPDHPPRTVQIPGNARWALPQLQQVNVNHAGGGTVPLQARAISVDDFKVMLDDINVEYVIPPQYTNVIIVQGGANSNSIVVRLPPTDILKGSEDDLLSGPNQYRIRDFYTVLFGHPPTNLPQTRAGKMELHANRVGEYTMANCD